MIVIAMSADMHKEMLCFYMCTANVSANDTAPHSNGHNNGILRAVAMTPIYSAL